MSTPDTDFMNELEAAARLRPHMASNILLFSIAGLFILFVLWAGLSRIDEITTGSGQVVPTRAVQVVQSLEGGILADLLVSEGDRVRKGQVLMRISDVQFASEERGTAARSAGLRAKKARLEAESRGAALSLPPEVAAQAPDVAANEQALYESRQQELANALSILRSRGDKARAEIGETQAQIRRLRESRALLSQELEITARMVAQKAVPKLEELRLRRELNDAGGQLSAQEEKLTGLQAELAATQRQLADQENRFRTQALGELAAVETELAQVGESLKSIGDRVDRTEIRAPVDGIVNNIALKTIGGVVEPAHRLVEIVPADEELKVVARVLPNDIAFLRPGQAVRVKIGAYDPQRYGALEGTLTRIGATSVTDREGRVYFEIEARTDKGYLGGADARLPITPGMVATVDVVTGRRTIMEYLMKPVLRLKDRALRER